MARVRVDIALSIAVAALIGIGAHTITENRLRAEEEGKTWKDQVSYYYEEGMPGAPADDSIPRAATIEEIKSQEGYFTVEIKANSYYEMAKFDKDYGEFFSVKLPSGETVPAKIFITSIKNIGNNMAVLPIGELVEEPLPQELLDSVRESIYPDDTSFYINMLGNSEASLVERVDVKGKAENIFLITTIICFLLVRFVTVKFGLFPPILPRKNKEAQA